MTTNYLLRKIPRIIWNKKVFEPFENIFEEFKKRTPDIGSWKNIKQKASKIWEIYVLNWLRFNTVSYKKEVPHWELESPNRFRSRHRFFKIGRKFLEKNLTYWVWRRLPWLVIRWINVTLWRKFLIHVVVHTLIFGFEDFKKMFSFFFKLIFWFCFEIF